MNDITEAAQGTMQVNDEIKAIANNLKTMFEAGLPSQVAFQMAAETYGVEKTKAATDYISGKVVAVDEIQKAVSEDVNGMKARVDWSKVSKKEKKQAFAALMVLADLEEWLRKTDKSGKIHALIGCLLGSVSEVA